MTKFGKLMLAACAAFALASSPALATVSSYSVAAIWAVIAAVTFAA